MFYILKNGTALHQPDKTFRNIFGKAVLRKTAAVYPCCISLVFVPV